MDDLTLPMIIREESGLTRAFLSCESLHVNRTIDGQVNIRLSKGDHHYGLIVSPGDARFFAGLIYQAAAATEHQSNVSSE